MSGQKLTEIILTRYRGLDDEAKLAFSHFINNELDINAERLAELAQTYAESRETDDFERLPNAAAPNGASYWVDLLWFMEAHPELGRTDTDFTHLLRSWFNSGFLVLKQIDWMAPASLLDKIAAYGRATG